MASTRKATKSELQPVAASAEEPQPQATEPTVDVVAMVSRRADGSPDQTDGFVVLDQPEEADSGPEGR